MIRAYVHAAIVHALMSIIHVYFFCVVCFFPWFCFIFGWIQLKRSATTTTTKTVLFIWANESKFINQVCKWRSKIDANKWTSWKQQANVCCSFASRPFVAIHGSLMDVCVYLIHSLFRYIVYSCVAWKKNLLASLDPIKHWFVMQTLSLLLLLLSLSFTENVRNCMKFESQML